MNKGITVGELLKMCSLEVKRGNANKHILISADDEANSYHTLFFGFDEARESIKYAIENEYDCHNAEEIILLG